jgi:hypothetical protein
MAAPNDPVVAISAPDVMKMPPPMHPDMPMPGELAIGVLDVKSFDAYLQAEAY